MLIDKVRRLASHPDPRNGARAAAAPIPARRAETGSSAEAELRELGSAKTNAVRNPVFLVAYDPYVRGHRSRDAGASWPASHQGATYTPGCAGGTGAAAPARGI